MRRKKQRRRVPEVLWRLFYNRARPLSETIISLLPLEQEQPPSHSSSSSNGCSCRGKRCFGCINKEEDPLSILLRPGDPSDYKKLLTRSYAVVSHNAPTLSRLYFGRRWTQKQIVKRTIEMIMYDKQMRDNVICKDYNECTQSSKLVDLLTTSAWSLFHHRIGDDLMMHLLKFVSIFLPLARENHHQISGFPISDLCSKFSKDVLRATFQQSLPNSSELPKKRKRISKDNCHWSCHMNIAEANTLSCCIANDNDKEQLQMSNKKNANSKKYERPFSWQRQRKRRQLNFAEVLTTCTSTTSEEETLDRKNGENTITSFNHHSLTTVHFQESEKKLTCSTFSEVAQFQCFCLWMLQEAHTVSWGAKINRKCIFYKSGCTSSLFPRNHILHSSKACRAGAISVMKDIFGLSDENLMSTLPSSHNCQFCLKGSACLFHKLLPLMKRLIRKSQRCHYLELMGKHCERSSRAHDHPFELNKSYCQKDQVVSFIWAVCRNIIPVQLLGAILNWRALKRNISKFIHLRKFEKFSLKQCMHGMKMSSIPLLSDKHSCYLNNHVLEKGAKMLHGSQESSQIIYILKKKIFSCWIHWVFSCLVVPIVQANFYVTDIEDGKLDIFYYPKASWKKLSSEGCAGLSNKNYNLLNEESLFEILGKRSFGFSKIRFFPKENGMRVLANLRASSKLKVPRGHQVRMRQKICKYKPINDVLRDLGAVLKGLKMKHPQKLGSSVFDYNDVYTKLVRFLVSLKSGCMKMPSLYVVICDISKAFDSVNQDKLLSAMKDVMLDYEYQLELSSEVICTKKSLWVHQSQMLSDQNMSTATAKATTSVPFHVLHRVRINQDSCKVIKNERLWKDLHEHLKGNVLQLENNYYLQKVGIPQGSVVSSLLCSFYYAHMETNEIFPFLRKIQEQQTSKSAKCNISEAGVCQGDGVIAKGAESNSSKAPNYVLLRFVDDFLFISTSKEQATCFFTRLQRGFKDYNCSINQKKSCMNFDVDHVYGPSLNRMYTGDDGVSFLPWSGLLINSCSLEIQADYTRYLNIHLESTLTVCWDNPGCHLKKRLCDYLKPKCHSIFYDSNINSAGVVRLNIYQGFLLCSMKFHSYVCHLLNVRMLQAEQYFEMIIISLRYMHKLIEGRMYSIKDGSKVRPILKLKKNEVLWLGLKAYIRVLQRKQPRHSQLLVLLKSELLRCYVEESASLKYAVDDSHSSLFWKIKY